MPRCDVCTPRSSRYYSQEPLCVPIHFLPSTTCDSTSQPAGTLMSTPIPDMSKALKSFDQGWTHSGKKWLVQSKQYRFGLQHSWKRTKNFAKNCVAASTCFVDWCSGCYKRRGAARQVVMASKPSPVSAILLQDFCALPSVDGRASSLPEPCRPCSSRRRREMKANGARCR